MPKQVRRSFDSCWTCRRRRVACDGAYPACSPCLRLPIKCEGYRVHLVWVDGHTGEYQSGSRRTLDPLSTWEGRPPYRNAQLQHLTNVDFDHVSCQCSLHTDKSNPFRVLKQTDAGLAPTTVHSGSLSDDQFISGSTITISRLPSSPLSATDTMLLHHYVNQVAFLLMPVDSAANPWRSVYPAIASQQSSDGGQSLYHALLSQAGFHLSVLHQDNWMEARKYRLSAMKHYCSALKKLQTSLAQTKDFKACAAVLYTFGQIEGCYASELTDWRRHFLGMYGLLTDFSQDSPWKMSSEAWVISQSLALSFEIAHTASVGSCNSPRLTQILLESISEVDQFGYTIGASCGVIQSIAKIRRLGEAFSSGNWTGEIDIESGRILGEIDLSEPVRAHTQASEDRQDYLNALHRRIFHNAAIIYLFRSIYNVAPHAIHDRITQVLEDTIEFINLEGGSISLWPVFITAVETSTPWEKSMVNQWLDYSCKLGISNRHTARRIIEHAWSLRDEEALLTGADPDTIVVDWREVQSQLKIDILLL